MPRCAFPEPAMCRVCPQCAHRIGTASRARARACRLPERRHERESTMASTATETTALAAFTLPGSPHSARMARFYIRAALTYHSLSGYADDAEMVASELIANAVTHAPAPVVTLALTWLEASSALGIVVTDPSPLPPVKRDPAKDREHGRGLHIVEALSARWGWQPRDPGKAVYAILTGKA
jgi:anti-sigma regulatory factor (Ser/Thr protein kinase)